MLRLEDRETFEQYREVMRRPGSTESARWLWSISGCTD